MTDREPATEICERLDRELDDLLDGEAARGGAALTRDAARDHVTGCSRCREEHGSLMAFLDRLAATPDDPVPPRLRPPAVSDAPRVRSARPLATRAAAVFAVAAAVGLWWRSQPSRVAVEPPREARASVVFAPLQRLTPIRIERRERVIEWRPTGANRTEFRTFTAAGLAAANASRSEEESR